MPARIYHIILLLLPAFACCGQSVPAKPDNTKVEWLRPVGDTDPSVWGIKNGIVVGLWPYGLENTAGYFGGGPRGLLRIGYECKGTISMINFLAIEPVVAGKIEFSEISPSLLDNGWGKLMWAGDNEKNNSFAPYAISRGVVDHPVPGEPSIERLSLFVFIEKFANGAHPYLKLFIRSDKPEELGIEIFEQEGSAKMDRCAISATMGNYARLRNVQLKGQVVRSKELYAGYNDISFVEKQSYPYPEFMTDSTGDFIVVASTDESFRDLAAWPQTKLYEDKSSWRYRPFFQLVQYWRKEKARFDPSLQLRVNGRAYYWAGGSADKARYAKIPNGIAFENFELRENFYSGQRFYFGLSRKTLQELMKK